MARTQFPAKTLLIGLFMVFAAMVIVAVIAYYRVGWYSIFGDGLAAIVAILGFRLAFRDRS